MLEIKTELKGYGTTDAGRPSPVPVHSGDHIIIRQTMEGWPGSGFEQKCTTIRARRVMRTDVVTPEKPDGKTDQLQVEIEVLTGYESGASRRHSASFSLDDDLAKTFIEFLSTAKERDTE